MREQYSNQNLTLNRSLRFEQCEDRRMLAATTDVVFLVDESESSLSNPVSEWIDDVVAVMQAEFDKPENDINARYGLVGFGFSNSEEANSYLVDRTLPTDDDEALFGNATQLATATTDLDQVGNTEDGWDAIEHAIAEYRIEPGAVPIFVLVQSEGGRATTVNSTLTQTGIEAALASKNVILNSVVAGAGFTPTTNPDPLFAINAAGSNERVLGVESDGADGIEGDRLHNYYGIDTVAHTPTGTHTPAGGQFNDNTGSSDQIDAPTGAEDEYVRLAWDTGGAVWDAGVIDEFGLASDEVSELNDRFAESLIDQINSARMKGRVFRDDEVLLALNVGYAGDGIPATDDTIDAGAAGMFRADDGTFTAGSGAANVDAVQTSISIFVEGTNSIPDGSTGELINIFQSYRGEFGDDPAQEDIVLSINQLDDGNGNAIAFPDGNYVVELFFADPEFPGTTAARAFDVLLEGQSGQPQRMLEGYSIGSDFAVNVPSTNAELDVVRLLSSKGVVKRFEVEVTGGSLEIELARNNSQNLDPILNAVRIIDANPPVISADFDGDGDIDGFDFLLWQRGFGKTNATAADGDANGDGVVDGMDLEIWSAQYDGVAMPDLDGDGYVDGDDLAMLEASYGVDAGGDIDGDGDTDGFDFLLWQRGFAEEQVGVTLAEVVAEYTGTNDPGIVYVSTINDIDDGDHTLGNLSLREAIKLANVASGPVTIILPAGDYELTLTGTEAGDASYNDLDITGDIRIVGDGAGLTILDPAGINASPLADRRIFDVQGSTAKLELSAMTLVNDSNGSNLGSAIRVQEGKLIIEDSAVASHSYYQSVAVLSQGADVTVRRSVFTDNDTYYGTGSALIAEAYLGLNGSVTIGDSIFALNSTSLPSVSVASGVALTNEGNNLYDIAAGGFFNTTSGVGDHQGTPDFVVTSIVDTFDHTDGAELQSIREAIDLANQASEASEVWLPAWDFVLTRDRATYGGGSLTDMDVSFGDLDISESITIRGITGHTAVRWESGVVDEIFDLLGDYNYDGDAYISHDYVYLDDHAIWQSQNGSSGAWEEFSADGDDDGDVDQDDYDVWFNHSGHTLDLIDIAIS